MSDAPLEAAGPPAAQGSLGSASVPKLELNNL